MTPKYPGSYPGGKCGAGVYQRLINEIPPHDVYCAPFAGFDAIARYIRPADRTILIDRDPTPLEKWAEYSPSVELWQCCGIEWLKHQFGLLRFGTGPSELATMPEGMQPGGVADQVGPSWFIYIDPPYPMATRTSGPMYKHEMTDAQHEELLSVIQRLPCNVMVSSYYSDLYYYELADWRSFTYFSMTRSGKRRKEFAWCNYVEPKILHDARFLGRDKREREKLNRRIRRLSRKLDCLPPLQRQAVLDAIRRP